MTIGEEMLSVEENSRSSTCWMLPGDAYERVQTMYSQFSYSLKSTLDEFGDSPLCPIPIDFPVSCLLLLPRSLPSSVY